MNPNIDYVPGSGGRRVVLHLDHAYGNTLFGPRRRVAFQEQSAQLFERGVLLWQNVKAPGSLIGWADDRPVFRARNRSLRVVGGRPVRGLPKAIPANVDFIRSEGSSNHHVWQSTLEFKPADRNSAIATVIRDLSVAGSVRKRIPGQWSIADVVRGGRLVYGLHVVVRHLGEPFAEFDLSSGRSTVRAEKMDFALPADYRSAWFRDLLAAQED